MKITPLNEKIRKQLLINILITTTIFGISFFLFFFSILVFFTNSIILFIIICLFLLITDSISLIYFIFSFIKDRKVYYEINEDSIIRYNEFRNTKLTINIDDIEELITTKNNKNELLSLVVQTEFDYLKFSYLNSDQYIEIIKMINKGGSIYENSED